MTRTHRIAALAGGIVAVMCDGGLAMAAGLGVL